jgi:hypothetical protein
MLSCIGLHESRIADHIGCKNAGEAAWTRSSAIALKERNTVGFYGCSDQESIGSSFGMGQSRNWPMCVGMAGSGQSADIAGA